MFGEPPSTRRLSIHSLVSKLRTLMNWPKLPATMAANQRRDPKGNPCGTTPRHTTQHNWWE